MKMETRNMLNVTERLFAISTIVALLVFAGWFTLPSHNSAPVAMAYTSNDNPLVGLWEMTVRGEAGTYLYKYTISEGSWITICNIDGGFYNVRYGPTLGAYAKNADGSYRYREIGWTYTRGGVCNGTFESTGTFDLDSSGTTFSGPGVFKQFDLSGNLMLTEHFTVVATKDAV